MRRTWSAMWLLVLWCGIGLGQEPAPVRPTADEAVVYRTLWSWPIKPRTVGLDLVKRYGLPHEVAPSLLIWYENGPWKRTVLHKEETGHDFPAPHSDMLEQVIDYRIRLDKLDDVSRFSGSALVDRTRGELSVRCDSEASNFLAINLIDDLVHGRKTVAAARAEYAAALVQVAAGNPPPAARGLIFAVQNAYTADPDRPVPAAATSAGL